MYIKTYGYVLFKYIFLTISLGSLSASANVFFNINDDISDDPTIAYNEEIGLEKNTRQPENFTPKKFSDFDKLIPRQFIVNFKPGTKEPNQLAQKVMQKFSKVTGFPTKMVRSTPFGYIFKITADNARDLEVSDGVLQKISKQNPEIEFFGEDPIVKVTALNQAIKKTKTENTLKKTKPSEEELKKQKELEFAMNNWNYELIKTAEAAAFVKNKPLTKVAVAVVDTGMTDHPQLGDRRISGYDFVNRDGDATDDYGQDFWHGLHVGGVIAEFSKRLEAAANSEEMIGLVDYRTMGAGGRGSLSDIILAILHTTGKKMGGIDRVLADETDVLPKVVNLSLGLNGNSSECHYLFNYAFKELAKHDIIAVVAAGNDEKDAMFTSPANCSADHDNVITVSAVTEHKIGAHYTNFGSRTDVAAPGGEVSDSTSYNVSMSMMTMLEAKLSETSTNGTHKGIMSTVNKEIKLGADQEPTPTMMAYQGTSMATPHVAALVAWMLAVNPSLSPKEVKTIMKREVIAFPSAKEVNQYRGIPCKAPEAKSAKAPLVVITPDYTQTDTVFSVPAFAKEETKEETKPEIKLKPSKVCGTGIINAHAVVKASYKKPSHNRDYFRELLKDLFGR